MDVTVGLLMVFAAGGSASHQNPSVEVQEGHNLTLKCPEKPSNNSLENWDWKRIDDPTNVAKSVIFSHRRGIDHPQPQMEQYKNRALVNKEDLRRGVLALTITSVRQADGGRYRCHIPGLGSFDFTVVVKNDSGTEFTTPTPTMDPDATKEKHMVTAITVPVGLGVAIAVVFILMRCRKKWNVKTHRGSRDQDNQYGPVTMMPAREDENDAAANGNDPPVVVINGLRG
ncbi:uncharacterized protein LOC114439914 [Parambassis ranga]|uniref:Uncharacterized protein LOC114439914 n=1 Tax=Parambassis ranga TaxID=210632 RepID=A0A6P7IRM5_9TELE|nr:uncharacterized protein LOC114439914 [Parambassis ranga]